MGGWGEKKSIASLSHDEAQRNHKELKHPWAGTGGVFAPWNQHPSWRKQDHKSGPGRSGGDVAALMGGQGVTWTGNV